MKAISIQQPWAWAVVNGFKPIENRDWSTTYRGEVLIHAGRADAGMESWHAVRARLRDCGDDPEELPELEALAKGGIVGRANLIDVVRTSSSPWFSGPFGFVFSQATPLRLIRCSGRLGLFDLPDALLEQASSTAAAGQRRLTL